MSTRHQPVLVLTRGDTGTLSIQLVEEPLGEPKTLQSGDTVVLRLVHRTVPDAALVKSCTISDAAQGVVSVVFEGEDLYLPAGQYDAAVDVTTAAGATTSTSRFTVELQDAVASNWLTNPSFEAQTAGWTLNGDQYHTVALTTSDAFDGGTALRVLRAATTGPREVAWQDVTVTPVLRPQLAEHVTVSCYLLPIRRDSGLSVLLRVRALDKAGSELGVSTADASAVAVGVWSRVSATLQLPSVVYALRVSVLLDSSSAAGGDVLFDAFQLEPGRRATPFVDK